ncbi:hypothetical protein [Stratiformator vulcanicus]|uniref:Uncharacterized protein n=1 Tax=Stratiformator vulcanicus TaxID=2527980 RepID=A0A517QXI3_9PLAN|nr:hypothetical protein [Stratiformator vulcanicus]QDT36362.1 hypothetical protein Pan189_07180 [Stratiformator vulcanicus]
MVDNREPRVVIVKEKKDKFCKCFYFKAPPEAIVTDSIPVRVEPGFARSIGQLEFQAAGQNRSLESLCREIEQLRALDRKLQSGNQSEKKTEDEHLEEALKEIEQLNQRLDALTLQLGKHFGESK